jgi:hypothetical protein
VYGTVFYEAGIVLGIWLMVVRNEHHAFCMMDEWMTRVARMGITQVCLGGLWQKLKDQLLCLHGVKVYPGPPDSSLADDSRCI